MELLLTLTNKQYLKEINNKVDGYIYGSSFSLKYNYTLDDLKEINDYLVLNNIKSYIAIDAFISESDLESLDEYFKYLKTLKLDGIYFGDLACINIAAKYEMADLLIYDPSSLNTNIRDVKFYLDNKISVMLARELTYEEINYLLNTYPNKLDIQVFGHERMSYSKRTFLTNYFKELKLNKNIDNQSNLTLVEESRNYKLPIKENKYGSMIYTDYIELMYEEYVNLKDKVNRGVLDSEFIALDLIKDVVNDFKVLNTNNAKELEDKLINKYQDVNFSKAYLYQKTVDKKENE